MGYFRIPDTYNAILNTRLALYDVIEQASVNSTVTEMISAGAMNGTVMSCDPQKAVSLFLVEILVLFL